MSDQKLLRALIFSGYGINCEKETAECFHRAGALCDIVHINEIIEKVAKDKNYLFNYYIIALPGGFSYGDHVGSGKILANKLRFKIGAPLKKFIDQGRALLGICNGFQVLTQAGILPGFQQEKSENSNGENSFPDQQVSLVSNISNHYEDRWVNLIFNDRVDSFWTKGIKSLMLPIRHGEGRLIWSEQEDEEKMVSRAAFFYSDEKKNRAENYPENPNGSFRSVAALVNEKGNVLGMMPHPEAFRWEMQAPNYYGSKITGKKCLANSFTNIEGELASYLDEGDGYGMTFFYNACHAMREQFLKN